MYQVGHLAHLFDQLVAEAGVQLQLHTMVGRPVVEDGCLQGVVLHSKSGPQVARARVVIDCTGDGDVAARAGCEFQVGRPGDGDRKSVV